eukprot:TRINITY_DN1985_c0_g6_i1.p3 TRINITY_DN1985_c0_g6~~TRINITY_DN1985_c0_g6_i1.p3  ORF type:complete len:52 (+),score=0.27 TRINITY_DN1985_c0_g6_i1:95-250(+)
MGTITPAAIAPAESLPGLELCGASCTSSLNIFTSEMSSLQVSLQTTIVFAK